MGRGGPQAGGFGRLPSLTLANALVAARAASAKTLETTVVLDVGDLIGITDYFIITAGRNERQVRSIVDEVGKRLRELAGLSVLQTEGLEGSHWVLLDYGDFVVHVFDTEARSLYSLERLWADAPRVAVDDTVPANVAGN
ncbi:MAG TPA: ribosome silencing factor [Acidimicrobiales bacterium]|nr:ribosome silencing factor [Acidimicrobiales bacterium]